MNQRAVHQWFRALAEGLIRLRVSANLGHYYLSTGCLHGRHDYCNAMKGLDGAKAPAQCKFCRAHCRCPCHRSQSGTPIVGGSGEDPGPGPAVTSET
jgi:hypothetical protein